MMLRQATALLGFLAALGTTTAFAPSFPTGARTAATSLRSTTEEEVTKKNVEQTEETSREKVMTFSYDMSTEMKYEKPTYPGTGNGLSGDEGEYDVIVIGSGMGGLTCGALSAKYGSKVLVLESHIKVGGSAHTFTRVHNGEKYSFEVGPSIFEGLDKPSLNPLRMVFDILEESMPVETYKGLGFWTPEGYWRFPIGDKAAFEKLLMDQCGKDGPKAIRVSLVLFFKNWMLLLCFHNYREVEGIGIVEENAQPVHIFASFLYWNLIQQKTN
jgi:hypothetical protein